MREWAEIYTEQGSIKGKIWAIHQMPDDIVPGFNPNSFRYAVEITGMNPKPGQGWNYNVGTGEFSAPDPVYITVLEVNEFWDRFTQAEKETLATSADPKIQTYRYDVFRVRSTINLEDPKTISAVNYLETNGFIAVGRAAEILTIEQV